MRDRAGGLGWGPAKEIARSLGLEKPNPAWVPFSFWEVKKQTELCSDLADFPKNKTTHDEMGHRLTMWGSTNDVGRCFLLSKR